MNKVNWTVVGVFGAIVLVALIVGLSLVGGGRGYGGWGMIGPGMMGPGMTLAPALRSGASAGVAGYGGWGYSPLGWIGMVFMWLIPIGLLVLTVLGVVWLVRTVTSGSGNPPASTRMCPNCGRSVQPDWRNCPHCGTDLSQL